MLDLRDMNKRIAVILSFILVLVCAGYCSQAQETPNLMISPDTVPPPPVCETDQPATALFEAETLTIQGPIYRATNNVFFQKRSMKIKASSLWYNEETGVGVGKNVVYTTCDYPNPDYRIEADEITILPNRKVHLRRPAIYLGNFRVLVLPSLKLRVGGNQSTTNLFPTPGFDDEDGFTLSKDFRLIDDDNLNVIADLRLTTNSGIQGQFSTEYGIGGDLERFPGRFLTYDSMRESVITLPKRPVGAPCPPEDLEPRNPARLRGFGVFSLQQRTYDIEDEGLVLYRQPELGLNYIGRQINFTNVRLDPRLEMYPQVISTWGLYRESPGPSGYIMKSSVMATVPLNVIPLGSRTSVQPVVQQGYSWYDNGDTYHTWAYAIDATHMFPNDSVVDIRYIKRNDSGETPFEFDNIDIYQELQAGFQIYMKKHVVGFVASYDIDDRSLYEWEVMYGYRTDCLATWLRWNNRLNKFTAHVSVISI